MPGRPELHPQIVEWGRLFKIRKKNVFFERVSPRDVLDSFGEDLKNYFSLAALSRNASAVPAFRASARQDVFAARAILEKSIIRAVERASCPEFEKVDGVLANNLFGFSKKQGTSLRMPLASCNPTKLCAPGCYAHDVLDAAPYAVIRGALNGWLASMFERSDATARSRLLTKLTPHVKRAIKNSQRELKYLPEGYRRRPFIRFSHVGEIVEYPEFSNALARLVKDLSQGEVDSVVYTRHQNVSKLDPSLWVVNFTLDPVSVKRLRWAPPHARIVFSAFGGVTSNLAEINFLEHHRHVHLGKTAGDGIVCPATAPETIVRTCDACKCNKCFTRK